MGIIIKEIIWYQKEQIITLKNTSNDKTARNSKGTAEQTCVSGINGDKDAEPQTDGRYNKLLDGITGMKRIWQTVVYSRI